MAFLLPVSVSFQPEWLKIQYLIPDWPFVCLLLFVKPWCFILVVGILKLYRGEGDTPFQCSSLLALQNPVTWTAFSSIVVASTFETIVHHLNLSFLHNGCKLVLITSHMVLGFPQQFLSVLHSLPLGGVPKIACLTCFFLAWELRSCSSSLYYHLFLPEPDIEFPKCVFFFTLVPLSTTWVYKWNMYTLLKQQDPKSKSRKFSEVHMKNICR